MTVRGEKIGQLRAEPARGKIREPAHVVQRLISRPCGDDAIHATKINGKERKERKRKFSNGRANAKPFHLFRRRAFPARQYQIGTDLQFLIFFTNPKIVEITKMIRTAESHIPL